jgi:hypothetical protein
VGAFRADDRIALLAQYGIFLAREGCGHVPAAGACGAIALSGVSGNGCRFFCRIRCLGNAKPFCCDMF